MTSSLPLFMSDKFEDKHTTKICENSHFRRYLQKLLAYMCTHLESIPPSGDEETFILDI